MWRVTDLPSSETVEVTSEMDTPSRPATPWGMVNTNGAFSSSVKVMVMMVAPVMLST